MRYLGPSFSSSAIDAGGDDGRAAGVERVHECRQEGQFVVHGVREEVGVDEDLVGGLKGGVVLLDEEHGGRGLGGCRGWVKHSAQVESLEGREDLHFSYQVVSFLLRLLLCIVLLDVLLQACIALAYDSFDRCEFAGALLYAHLGGLGGFCSERLCSQIDSRDLASCDGHL